MGFVYDATDGGAIIFQHVRAMNSLTDTFTVAENRDWFRASATLLSDHAT